LFIGRKTGRRAHTISVSRYHADVASFLLFLLPCQRREKRELLWIIDRVVNSNEVRDIKHLSVKVKEKERVFGGEAGRFLLFT
jgi:hypothetical protein